MATTKVTRKAALSTAIAVLGEDYPAEVVVLERMLSQLCKPRKVQTKGKTKARLANEGTAVKVWRYLVEEGDGKTSTEIAGALGLGTPQKASAVCGIAAELGYVVRVQVGKHVTWAVGDVVPAEDDPSEDEPAE
jgi:hypothetical protein